MLLALTSPHPSLSLSHFNEWYDERHAPSRAACPGVHSVCRFHLVDEARSSQRVGHWTWLAMYELEREDALRTPEYMKARQEDGDDESKMLDFLSRRVYALLEDKRRDDYAAFASSGSRLMSVIGLSSNGWEKETTQDAVKRYIQESIAANSAHHGWIRTSFWQLTTAADPRTWQEQTDVPRLLALHEWEDGGAVRESGALHEASDPTLESTSGSNLQVQEKALLTLWKQF